MWPHWKNLLSRTHPMLSIAHSRQEGHAEYAIILLQSLPQHSETLRSLLKPSGPAALLPHLLTLRVLLTLSRLTCPPLSRHPRFCQTPAAASPCPPHTPTPASRHPLAVTPAQRSLPQGGPPPDCDWHMQNRNDLPLLGFFVVTVPPVPLLIFFLHF